MNKIKRIIISSLICTSGFVGVTCDAHTLNYSIWSNIGATPSVCDGYGTCSNDAGQMQINDNGVFCMQWNPWVGAKSHQVAIWTDMSESASVFWEPPYQGITLTNATFMDPEMVDGGCPIWG
jgi:hypothetical protein